MPSEDPASLVSGPARKRPRPLEEAVEGGDGVSLKFSDSFAVDSQKLVLLQVPESLLKEIGEDADLGLVKLIGGEDEDAVLVTGGQTFKLTKAETSNTLLLVPPEGAHSGGGGGSSSSGNGLGNGNVNEDENDRSGSADGGGSRKSRRSGGREWSGDGANGEGGFEAVAAVGFQFEVSKKTPSLEQIRVILEGCMYRGKGEEAAADRERLEKCSLAELQSRVQSSHRELLQGLKELEALHIEGRWRMVDPALMERTADALLAVVVEQDMPLDKVDAKACIDALPDCEPRVLEHCLRTYSVPAHCGEDGGDYDGVSSEVAADNTPGTATATAAVHRRLDLTKVARLRAHQILRAHEAGVDGSGGISHPEDVGPLSLSDFMERWATSMPGVETPSEELLKGIALVDKKDGKDKIKISYVPASGLPFSPAERLAALFRIKSKWPMGELEPYISEADRKAGFLLKNTRFSTDPTTGQKLFSAR